MSVTFDEYGRPFIILREQERVKRTRGLEAQKVSSALLGGHSCVSGIVCESVVACLKFLASLES